MAQIQCHEGAQHKIAGDFGATALRYPRSQLRSVLRKPIRDPGHTQGCLEAGSAINQQERSGTAKEGLGPIPDLNPALESLGMGVREACEGTKAANSGNGKIFKLLNLHWDCCQQ